MADFNDIVRLGVDAYHHNTGKYSEGESMEALRAALIEANGGKTTIDYKSTRGGQSEKLFTIVEEILKKTVVSGFTGNEFFNELVDFRNMAEGDLNDFQLVGDTYYEVAEVGEGNTAVRRQRLNGVTHKSIATTTKIVRIYEELNRVLSGRVDFNQMIDDVGKAFMRKLCEDIWDVWAAATSVDLGGSAYCPTAGTYDPAALRAVVNHVEAATGLPAKIICTKEAGAHLVPPAQGANSEADIYNTGFYGRFYGTPVYGVPQRHRVGTTQFAFNDFDIFVVAGDEKPIKCVYEGSPLIMVKEPTVNYDLTQEYIYADKYGVGFVTDGACGVGKYTVTGWGN